jgi:hypothetical protein
VYVYVYVCMCMCMCVCVCVFVCVFVYVCMYVYVFMYVCMCEGGADLGHDAVTADVHAVQRECLVLRPIRLRVVLRPSCVSVWAVALTDTQTQTDTRTHSVRFCRAYVSLGGRTTTTSSPRVARRALTKLRKLSGQPRNL